MMTTLPFNDFYWTRFEFVMRTKEALRMPLYKGATLRGTFGNTLKRICCYQNPADCNAQPPECRCTYGDIFAPKAPPGINYRHTGDEVARPFVIEPPLDSKRDYQPGETLTFHILLFGRAIHSLPYFLVAFNSLPPMGIPPHRGHVQMQEIWAVNDLTGIKQRIYNETDHSVLNFESPMTYQELLNTLPHDPQNRLTLRLETHTHLVYQSKEIHRIEFHILVSSLLRRIETLMILYHNPDFYTETWRGTAKHLIHEAKNIQIANDRTSWQTWERFSNRQNQKVPMHGLTGELTYEGCLEPYRPLLALGQYTHLGKNGVFGMGKYRILP